MARLKLATTATQRPLALLSSLDGLGHGGAAGQGSDSMRIRWCAAALLVCLVCAPRPAAAQTSDGNYLDLLSASAASTVKAMHATIARDLTEAAAMMTEDEYSFRPTPETRTFAELVGHLANANAFFCAQARGERPPTTINYEKVSDRAELMMGLSDALAYCDTAVAATTDANASSMVKLIGPGDHQTSRAAGTGVQHDPQQRALRQHGRLPAPEGSRAAFVCQGRAAVGRHRLFDGCVNSSLKTTPPFITKRTSLIVWIVVNGF